MSNKISKLRKILKSIPNNTNYCYSPDVEKNIEAEKNGDHSYYIKPCEFYQSKEGLIGKCKLYNCEVIDQVKVCGLRTPN